MAKRGPSVLIVTLLLVSVLAAANPSGGQAALDPKSVVGDWKGEYLVRSQSYSNKVYVTIKSVTEDGKAAGTIYLAGPAPYHNKDLQLVDAVLKDNKLSFKIAENPRLFFDFAIKGNEMSAVVLGVAQTEFTLKK